MISGIISYKAAFLGIAEPTAVLHATFGHLSTTILALSPILSTNMFASVFTCLRFENSTISVLKIRPAPPAG